jgi:hypothetical protein
MGEGTGKRDQGASEAVVRSCDIAEEVKSPPLVCVAIHCIAIYLHVHAKFAGDSAEYDKTETPPHA